MGAGAIAPDRFDDTHSGVQESFSTGSALASAGLSVNPEAEGLFCDGDGVLDVGETALVTVRVRNNGFEDLNSAERSEEHTSELQSLMRISYAVFCLKKNMRTKDELRKTSSHIRTTSQRQLLD